MSGKETRRSVWSFFTVLFFAAFGLNWLWEMAQMPAYVEMAGLSWGETFKPCTVAALGDVLITFAICGVGALAAGQCSWAFTGTWNVYATTAVLGTVSAAAFEWFSLATGRWSYSHRMPVVPVLGVGFWPVLQLTFLVPIALLVAHVWAKRI